MLDLDRLALGTACPTCGAPPGLACHKPNDAAEPRPTHKDRVQLAAPPRASFDGRGLPPTE